jgi:LysM repeat protein
MSVRRMVPFILINIVVSATVVLLILFLWDTREPGEETAAVPTEAVPTVQTAPGEITPGTGGEATQEPQPNPDGPTTHTVQAGESLGIIGEIYGVPVADIMAANGIENPNFIQVNQVLVIPIGGLATETPPPTPTATPNVAPSPIATEPPTQGEAVVEISEVIGVGSLADEAVSIVNSGNRPIALLDWELSDEDGSVYTFGLVTLFGDGAAILVHTEEGQDGFSDLYWGLEQPIWESGETVVLTDSEGTVRVTYTIP